MAEAVVFSIASNILSTLASPAFNMVYKKGLSIRQARDELAKLRTTIETIKSVLLDAERKQVGSAAVRNWVKRLKAVLFEADDLFDQVLTDDLLKQQLMETRNNLSLTNHVRVSFFNLNPVISRNSIAKKVKAIRKSLLEISADMAQFEFVRCQNEERTWTGITSRQDPGCFVDVNAVIGRDADKSTLLEMLFNDPADAQPHVSLVIAIVGIGGMGKTTLAQLLYNDKDVEKNFENRWFVCISDTFDERLVLGKIFQSICEGSYSDLDVSTLQTKIRKSIMGKKCLLVLDDVWEDHRGRWQDRMRLLNSGAEGSRIVVTTRSLSVVNAVNALKSHRLEGLSVDDSWYLFKSLAFVPGYEDDPRRESLGRNILKRCRCVPLAIWSTASLLFEKNTIAEWEAIEKEGLPTLPKKYNDETMSVLKLSYDYLPSHLKQCFAYCSLFPKDYWFSKQELTYLWIAHGYIDPDNKESDFMHLLRRGFFQDAREDAFGEVQSCKMHDIMHDLALYVAGDECSMMNGGPSDPSICSSTRHVSLVLNSKFEESSWAIPASLLDCKWSRSCMLMRVGSISSPTNLDKLFTSLKMLRTLSLSGMGIENISASIGELKLLRYVDLSYNNFEELPASMTNLVNLTALNLASCCQLKALPQDFRKLINLTYLNIEMCIGLKQMPIGIGELTQLVNLSDLKAGKGSELDALAGFLQQLRGKLLIEFKQGIDEDGDECSWQLPISLHKLVMWWYPGMRIPGWGNNSSNNLARLEVGWCKKLKYLPPLRCLPNLKWLLLEELWELEFLEEDEINGDSSILVPSLKELTLDTLPKLKGWWKKAATLSPLQIPLLSFLNIYSCPELELKSFPTCPHLRRLILNGVGDNASNFPIQQQQQQQQQQHLQQQQQQLLSTIFYSSTPLPMEDISIVCCNWVSSFQDKTLAFLRCLRIDRCNSLKSLHLASAHLQSLEIKKCDQLASIELGEVPMLSFSSLKIQACRQLKMLHISVVAKASLLKLDITDCPELELWELQDQTWPRLDWDSLPNLRFLRLYPLPPPTNLPNCLQRRRKLGKLVIDSFIGVENWNYMQLRMKRSKELCPSPSCWNVISLY